MSALHPQLRLGQLWFALGLLIAIGILLGSLLPSSKLPDLHLWDKARHALAYLLLAFWFASILRRGALPVLLVCLLCFGGGIELLQGWMQQGREADWRDMTANAAGIAFGLLLGLSLLGRWPRLLESLLPGRAA